AKKSKRRRSKKDKKDKDDNIKSKKRKKKVQKKKSTSSSSSSSSKAGDEGSVTAAAPAATRVPAAQAKQHAAAPGVSERFSDLMLGIEEEDSEGEPNSGGPGAEKAELFDPEAPPQEELPKSQAAPEERLRPKSPEATSSESEEPVTPPATSPPQRGAAVDPGDAEKASALIEDVELAFPSLMRFDLDFEQLGSVRLKDQAQAQGVLNSIDPLFWEVCGVKQLGHRLLFAKGLRALPPGPQRVFCSKQPVNSRVAMLAPGVMNGVIRRDYDYDYHDFRQA
ncbi:unnamed protein product, partial [Symbiodinium microadriaticum]